MKTLNIHLPNHSYPIFIGENLFNHPALLKQYTQNHPVMIVSSARIFSLHGQSLLNALIGQTVHTVFLPEGESFKTWQTVQLIFDALLEHHLPRNTLLIALGGGNIGDITGFAAACYQRGIDFLQIPTTLLAQTDAAIGGKTGVNHPHGKNMIGAFHQPNAIFIDIHYLKTLSDREYYAGFAEIVKHSLIADPSLFSDIENHLDAIHRREPDTLINILLKSIRVKVALVMQDEQDRLGVRQQLNLGHTFAHGIETITNYQRYLHGETVAIGLVLACRFSETLRHFPKEETKRIIRCLQALRLPTTYFGDIKILLNAMKRDKKNSGSQTISFILLNQIGQTETVTLPDPVVFLQLERVQEMDSILPLL